ncbi:MAG: TolC family outer membrane protein [Negativicutes bacterium]|nr:TolC family outer membrane protein [Negativicutes bacterium]
MKNISCAVSACALILTFIRPAQAEYMTLEQVLTQAYQNNPSLESARAKLRATDEQVDIALSHWRPKIEATSSVGKTYQRIPAQQDFDTANYGADTTSYGAQITQPLFRGFRTLSETEAAKKQVDAGRAQLQDAEQKILLDTATTFLDVVRDESVLDFDRDNETVLHKKLEETKVRARVGDLTNTDIQQAESRLARAEVSRLQTENTLQQDRDAFLRLVGDEPASLAKPVLAFDKPQSLEETLRFAETRNPDVIAAQYTLDESDAEVDEQKGSLLPELNLVASTSRNLGENAITPGRYDSSAVMLQLKIPLYEAGQDYAQIRQAEQTSVQHRMELEDARHRAHENAHNAWQALLTSEAAVKADKAEIAAAAKALEGVKVQAHVGTRTTLDELNAEQELLDAKTELAKSEHDRNLAVLQIKSAIGELTADALRLPLDSYNPKQHYDDNHAKWIGFGGADDDIYAKKRDEVALKPAAIEVPAPEPAVAETPVSEISAPEMLVPEAVPVDPVEIAPASTADTAQD